MERDPFRPQDPWKAEWDMHTQRYQGEHGGGGRIGMLPLLGIWVAVVAVVALLSLVLSATATFVVAGIAFVLLLLTVRV